MADLSYGPRAFQEGYDWGRDATTNALLDSIRNRRGQSPTQMRNALWRAGATKDDLDLADQVALQNAIAPEPQQPTAAAPRTGMANAFHAVAGAARSAVRGVRNALTGQTSAGSEMVPQGATGDTGAVAGVPNRMGASITASTDSNVQPPQRVQLAQANTVASDANYSAPQAAAAPGATAAAPSPQAGGAPAAGQQEQTPHTQAIAQQMGTEARIRSLVEMADRLQAAGFPDQAQAALNQAQQLQEHSMEMYGVMLGRVAQESVVLLSAPDDATRAQQAMALLNRFEGKDAQGNQISDPLVPVETPAWQSIRQAVNQAAADGLSLDEVRQFRMSAIDVSHQLNAELGQARVDASITRGSAFGATGGVYTGGPVDGMSEDAIVNAATLLNNGDESAIRGIRNQRQLAAIRTVSARLLAADGRGPEAITMARAAVDASRRALGQLETTATMVQAAEDGAIGLADDIENMLDSGRVQLSNSPELNRIWQDFQRRIMPPAAGGDMDEWRSRLQSGEAQREATQAMQALGLAGDQIRYMNLIMEFSTEYAKVLSGSYGAGGVSDSSIEHSMVMLNPTMTPDQVRGAISAARTAMERRVEGYNTQRNRLRETIRTGGRDILGGDLPGERGGHGIAEGGAPVANDYSALIQSTPTIQLGSHTVRTEELVAAVQAVASGARTEEQFQQRFRIPSRVAVETLNDAQTRASGDGPAATGGAGGLRPPPAERAPQQRRSQLDGMRPQDVLGGILAYRRAVDAGQEAEGAAAFREHFGVSPQEASDWLRDHDRSQSGSLWQPPQQEGNNAAATFARRLYQTDEQRAADLGRRG